VSSVVLILIDDPEDAARKPAYARRLFPNARREKMFHRLVRYVRWLWLMRRFDRAFGKRGKVPF